MSIYLGGCLSMLTGVWVRSHICDHKFLTFVQRLYIIANIRAQVLNVTVLKRPAFDDSLIIEFLLRRLILLENMSV